MLSLSDIDVVSQPTASRPDLQVVPFDKNTEGFNVSCDAKLSMSVPDSFKRWRC